MYMQATDIFHEPNAVNYMYMSVIGIFQSTKYYVDAAVQKRRLGFLTSCVLDKIMACE